MQDQVSASRLCDLVRCSRSIDLDRLAPAATCCFEHKKVEYNFNIRLYIRECSVDEGETSGDAPAIVVLVSGDNAVRAHGSGFQFFF